MPLTLILNGQQRNFDQLNPGSSLSDLLDTLEIKPDRVALERNAAIAPRASWTTTYLSELDKIELVHFVGGGNENKCKE